MLDFATKGIFITPASGIAAPQCGNYDDALVAAKSEVGRTGVRRSQEDKRNKFWTLILRREICNHQARWLRSYRRNVMRKSSILSSSCLSKRAGSLVPRWYVIGRMDLNICTGSTLRSSFSTKRANGGLKMKFLIDTNIFLEVMLNQQHAQEAKSFLLESDIHEYFISDFSWESSQQVTYGHP